MLADLTDPRKTTEAQAQEIIHKTGKPIYWATSGIHSPETGGPEMLIELAYRLIIEETPFIQTIRTTRSSSSLPWSKSTAARSRSTTILLRQENRQGPSAAHVLGQIRRAR